MILSEKELAGTIAPVWPPNRKCWVPHPRGVFVLAASVLSLKFVEEADCHPERSLAGFCQTQSKDLRLFFNELRIHHTRVGYLNPQLTTFNSPRIAGCPILAAASSRQGWDPLILNSPLSTRHESRGAPSLTQPHRGKGGIPQSSIGHIRLGTSAGMPRPGSA